MNTRWIAAVLLAGLALAARADGKDMTTPAAYLAESREVAREFMQTLGDTLKQQIAAGGVASAIGVCQQVAPALATQYSSDARVVKRVSLKPRNRQLGVPDGWEKSTLENFDREQQAGKSPAEMEVTAFEVDEDGNWFRYMKAIPTQAMCLQCHGSAQQIPDDVKALLRQAYPQDQATGYRAGQIRGAVSIKRKVQ